MPTRSRRNKNATTPTANEAARSTLAAALSGRDSASVFEVPETRRVLPTLDLVSAEKVDPKELIALFDAQEKAATHFYVGLNTLQSHFSALVVDAEPTLPQQITGSVTQPDNSPGAHLLVTANPPSGFDNTKPWPNPATMTDEKGFFTLSIPSGTPAKDGLTLRFKGAHESETRSFALDVIETTGILGAVILKQPLDPMPQSIVGSLVGLLSGAVTGAAPETSPASTQPLVQVKLGTDDCPLTFYNSQSVDRFPYGVLIRLVEPRTSILTRTFRLPLGLEGRGVNIALRNPVGWGAIRPAQFSFTDRVPVDQPISVDGFRDRIIGNEGGTIGVDETVPMAGTLGLGYVIQLAQKWTPAGLSLGDLVYSLPLAPGEQQRIAVFEQRQTLTSTEFESLDDDEQQFQRQQSDSSTQATFESAFAESVRGSSHYNTSAESSSWGAAGGAAFSVGFFSIGGGAAGGGGSSSASGDASQSLDGAKNYTSHAAQQTHSATERQAFARRRAQRTNMRLATATDTERATTKVITNNNRAHALTIQYWEVLRHFEVSTAVEGATLVCFVPLEVVRFLPPFVSLNLVESEVNTRDGVLRRYGPLAKHVDVIRPWLPRQYRQGLSLLEAFVSNPRSDVDLASFSEEVVNIHLFATVLPFEDIYVSIVTRRGTRMGPTLMTNHAAALPDALSDAANAAATRTELLTLLHSRRNSFLSVTKLSADVVLPRTIAPDDVVGFELTRRFRPLHYMLAPKKDDPAYAALMKAIESGKDTTPVSLGLFGIEIQEPISALLNGVHLSPEELEHELGGPFAYDFTAAIPAPPGAPLPGGRPPKTETYAAGFFSGATELPAGVFPIPALQVSPLLRFNDLLTIEQTLQHVVRNCITYSRAVWMSLTPEERAIMLEGYTIGVPADGIVDDTQHIPLLNCVLNQVLGFYGNSMILPFSIPPEVANDLGLVRGDDGENRLPLTTGAIQDALTRFHKQAFSPPVSHIALPTHGVLGEAVLGHCPAAEKIDLTRFWNWQDSPIPQASDALPSSLNKGTNLLGAAGPNTLANLPAIINNVGTAAGSGSDNDLVKALIGAQKLDDFSASLTGGDKLAELTGKTLDTAESARKDALGAAQNMATKALDKVSDVLKAQGAAKDEAKKAADAKETKRNDQIKAAIKDLKENAESYQSVADGKADQAAADKFAADVVKTLSGDVALTPVVTAPLQAVYKDNTAHPKGSSAFLKALGLSS